uniref:Uncharacterized protein n=1 Tax=Vespula pensylvanica TaxID=30213 RepID=A0A834U4V0_VESPE|nr:hypothetical protein H0235_011144 [Vespula pensylvanica]
MTYPRHTNPPQFHTLVEVPFWANTPTHFRSRWLAVNHSRKRERERERERERKREREKEKERERERESQKASRSKFDSSQKRYKAEASGARCGENRKAREELLDDRKKGKQKQKLKASFRCTSHVGHDTVDLHCMRKKKEKKKKEGKKERKKEGK